MLSGELSVGYYWVSIDIRKTENKYSIIVLVIRIQMSIIDKMKNMKMTQTSV